MFVRKYHFTIEQQYLSWSGVPAAVIFDNRRPASDLVKQISTIPISECRYIFYKLSATKWKVKNIWYSLTIGFSSQAFPEPTELVLTMPLQSILISHEGCFICWFITLIHEMKEHISFDTLLPPAYMYFRNHLTAIAVENVKF